ncbi:hypothetical protein Glove_9g180 [Diversispora epigaea]|uniref:TLDc domain-containing protein n=1 Tax=Diversispora epigaea TaxID=1348612 RepID=A0A397JX92_9GLOM|nr:hypothetical protein Glove_9g180 [Diversispora epigaea]
MYLDVAHLIFQNGETRIIFDLMLTTNEFELSKKLEIILIKNKASCERKQNLGIYYQMGIAQSPTLLTNLKEWNKENFLTSRITIQQCLPYIRYFHIHGDDIWDKVKVSSWIDNKTTAYSYEFQLILRGIKGTDEILGGYNPLMWDNTKNNTHMYTNDSFIFTLKNGNLQNSIINGGKKPHYCGIYYQNKEFTIEEVEGIIRKTPNKKAPTSYERKRHIFPIAKPKDWEKNIWNTRSVMLLEQRKFLPKEYRTD